MIAAAIVVPPLPFFVITVTHFYHPRYFCGVLPFLLLLVAGGIAVTAIGARRAAQRLLERYGEKSSQRTHNAALHAAAAIPFIVFAAQVGPVSARALDALYTEDFTRGLHYEFAHDITTAYLREQAAATDMAAMCFPRPDWRFYYRKNLADHLIEPVRPNEPFKLWYVGGMANCVNVSDFPTGARFERMIREDWLEKRTIFLFEVTAPHIRTILGNADFGAVDDPGIGVQRHIEDLPVVDSGAPLRFEARDHGETARYATAPVPALPHRYVEFILTATGPPQYGLALDYYDTTGRFLHREVFRMRDVQTQREPHPTGDTPPMAPRDDAFTIKLADVSPPLAAFVHAELLIEGDTRRGDVYDVQSIEVRANWRDEAQGVDLDLPPFTTDRGTVEDWTVLAERSAGERPMEVTRSGEMTITASGGPAQFRIESRMFPIRDLGSLQFELPFKGNPDLISRRPSSLTGAASGSNGCS
jgi:hypothetical protein